MKLIATILLATICLNALPADAATRAWNRGAGTGNWANNLNWNNQSFPVTGDLVNIDQATGPVITTAGNTAGEMRLGTTNGGTGNLTLSGGGVLTTNGIGYVGYAAGSTSTVNVTGASSSWYSSSNLYVANNGNGTLNISNGGSVRNTGSYIGTATGVTGHVNVDGTGSLWTSTGIARVGNSSTGFVDVTNGGDVISAGANVGNVAGGVGTITVSGAGSTWNSSAVFNVGNSGNGTLNITNGGAVSVNTDTSLFGYIGNNASTTGSVTVSGAGSNFTSNSSVSIARLGTGALNISNQGQATIRNLLIGERRAGQTNVDGAGSALYLTHGLRVGQSANGIGTLNITNGGLVENGGTTRTVSIMGTDANSVGIANVTGTGSTLNNITDLFVGRFGAATLTVSNGGLVRVATGTTYTLDATVVSTATVYIGYVLGSTGTLNIGAAVGDAAVASGTVDAAHVAFGEGTGSLVFNHTNNNYIFAPSIIGNGTIRFLSGETILTGDTSSFSGSFMGNGNVTLTNDGETSIAGDSSAFTGMTTVADGSLLRVNGNLGGDTVVGDGGRVQGNGTLMNFEALLGGTVAPGNSIGTLNVTNAVFNAGSTYEVEVNQLGASDRIIASNTATLTGGTVRAIAFPNYTNTPYTILTAANGVTGTFDGAVDDFLFVDSVLSYDANNAYLTLARNAVDAIDAAATRNQLAVAAQLDRAAPGGNAAIDTFYLLPGVAAAQSALDQLSGEMHASVNGALLDDQRLLQNAMESADAEYLGSSGRLWAKGTRSWARGDGDDNAAAADHITTGILIGAESQLAERLSVGLALGTGTTELGTGGRSGDAETNNYHALAYIEHKAEAGFKLKGGVSGSWHTIETERTIDFSSFSDTARADYDAQSAQAFAELGYDLTDGDGLTLSPYAQLAYGILHANGFSEDGTVGLKGEEQTNDRITSTLGVRVAQDVTLPVGERLRFEAGLGWQHAYGDVDPEAELRLKNGAGSGNFTVLGMPLDRDTLLLGVGFSFLIDDSTRLGFGYDASLGDTTTRQSINAKLGMTF